MSYLPLVSWGPIRGALMPTPTSSPTDSRTKKKRTTYDHAFKLKVVRAALERPPNNRIKPTCAWFPGIEPCQAEHGHSLNPSLLPAAQLPRAAGALYR